MRTRYILYILFFLSLVFCLAACSSRPVAQIERTDQAMQQARDEYAQTFATEDWITAETAYNDAQKMLDQEKWREANMLLLKAMTSFQKARDIAKSKREEKIRFIESKQKSIEIRCTNLRETYDANRTRIAAAKRKELDATCETFQEKMATITDYLKEGRYQDAETLATKTEREVWEVGQELQKIVGK